MSTAAARHRTPNVNPETEALLLTQLQAWNAPCRSRDLIAAVVRRNSWLSSVDVHEAILMLIDKGQVEVTPDWRVKSIRK